MKISLVGAIVLFILWTCVKIYLSGYCVVQLCLCEDFFGRGYCVVHFVDLCEDLSVGLLCCSIVFV